MDDPETLRNIIRRAHRNVELIDQKAARTTKVSPPRTHPSLTLPHPTPLTDHLMHTGWNREAAEHLSNAYMRHAIQRKIDFEHNLNKAIADCLQVGPSTTVQAAIADVYSAYAAMYQRDLSQRAMLAKKRISELAPSSAYNASGALNETGQFKQNVVPLLEKVFSANSYPSGDEKRTLAALTGMEYKQVKTWFQNKRSRCKREGKEIQKFVFVIKGDDGQNPSQCGVAGGPPVSSLAPRPCTPAAPSQTLAPTSRAVCPFHIERPPYAFPTIFSLISDYKPFPLPNEPQTFDVPWPRHASVEHHTKKADDHSFDIEQLCTPFSRMSMMDDRRSLQVSSSKAANRPSRLRDYAPPCFPSLVCPPAAPLPALVSATVTVYATNVAQSRSSSPSSLSRHSVCVPTEPTTLTTATSTRKSADILPLRIPQSLPKQARDAGHPYRSYKPPKSNEHQARLLRLPSMSSLSSLSSDGSCSSRASSASLESPPPITPPQLSVELPRSRKVSGSDLVFSPSQDLDDLFSDSDTPTLNFLDNRQLHQPRIVQ